MCETPCLGCWLLLAACVSLSVCLKSCMHQEVLPLVDLDLVLPLGPVSVIFQTSVEQQSFQQTFRLPV